MSDGLERISCLMVTRPSPERFEFLKHSLACFQAQTYPNRELVMVLDQGPAEWVERIKDYLASLGVNAMLMHPPTKHTMGALRNLSVQAASGSLLCPWDDDDFSHPTRLAEQYDLLIREGAIAVALQEVLCLFRPSREMYWMNFRNAPTRCHPNTVLFRRDVRARYPEDRSHAHTAVAPRLPAEPAGAPNDGNSHEDTALVLSLQAEGKFLYLAGAPHLFVWVNHGGNTCGNEFFQMLAQSLGLSRGLLERRRAVFDKLDRSCLGEGLITVTGYNGPAFQIPGRPDRPLDA